MTATVPANVPANRVIGCAALVSGDRATYFTIRATGDAVAARFVDDELAARRACKANRP